MLSVATEVKLLKFLKKLPERLSRVYSGIIRLTCGMESAILGRTWGGFMKIKVTSRIFIGFLAGFIFLWRANPTYRSFVIGSLVMIFGECIRFISAGTLIKFEGVTRNGIYAFTRNPLYLGSFLMGIGACIAGLDLYFALFFIVLFPQLYLRVIRREEIWLSERYGDEYVEYCRKTPRIIPRRFDVAEVIRETSPFLAIKNRELRTILGLVIVLVIMAIKLAI